MDPQQSWEVADELATLACEARDHGGNHVLLYRLAELTVKHLDTCESTLEQTRRELAHAERALLSSRDIGVAMGVLMSRYAIDREAAFNLLRRASQQTQLKVRDLAAEFLRTGRLPEADRSAQTVAQAATRSTRTGSPFGTDSMPGPATE